MYNQNNQFLLNEIKAGQNVIESRLIMMIIENYLLKIKHNL